MKCFRCKQAFEGVAECDVNAVDVKASGLIQQASVAQFGFKVPLCEYCRSNYINTVLTNEMPFNARGLRAWLAGDAVTDGVARIPAMTGPGLPAGRPT